MEKAKMRKRRKRKAERETRMWEENQEDEGGRRREMGLD